ncbi:MAG: membrane protein insertion efficiency factor YidD [Planctomycetes bacterium]|nr:membrane protein insertion efficiency factor YidD [Planctomycetota bacterium]
MKLLRQLVVLPIRVYQRVLSPLTPPSCRYEPSCSEYGAQAILAHGFCKGGCLGAWRILRCHPFTAGGLDPVPPPGRWRSAARARVPTKGADD